MKPGAIVSVRFDLALAASLLYFATTISRENFY